VHDLVTGGHPDAPQFRFVEEVGLAAVTLIAALIAAEHIRWVVAHLTPPVLGAALLAIAGGLSLLRSRARLAYGLVEFVVAMWVIFGVAESATLLPMVENAPMRNDRMIKSNGV
jgi:hypothetical protein